MSSVHREKDAVDALRAAVETERWEEVDRIFNEDFFALLLTDANAVHEAFLAAPPDWYQSHPRHLMSRGIAAAAGPLPLVSADVDERFAAWVTGQARPAARDRLGVLSSRLRALMSTQRFFEADAVADRMVDTIRNAREHSGFTDVLPSTLVRIGVAKLLTGDTRSASQLFAEAHRWANAHRTPHPIDRHVRDHLALSAALSEDYAAAAHWLTTWHGRTTHEPGLRYNYESVGLAVHALVAVGQADVEAARLATEQADDDGVRFSTTWWAAIHARARYELFWGDPYEGIALIERNRQLRGTVMAPAFGVKLLRADLADLWMMVGDLPSAERELRRPGSERPHYAVLASSVRLELFRGRPKQAVRVIAEAGPAWERGRPTFAVLAALVERALSGHASPASQRRAALTVSSSGARSALLEADDDLRSQLSAVRPGLTVAVVNEYETHVRAPLTRREAQILRSLQQFETPRAIAAALHVSPNTVKSHLRSLYRKLGVHTRDEALRHFPGGPPHWG